MKSVQIEENSMHDSSFDAPGFTYWLAQFNLSINIETLKSTVRRCPYKKQTFDHVI